MARSETRRRRRGGCGRALLIAFALVALVVAAGLFALGWYASKGAGGGSSAGRPVQLEIAPGSTTEQIAEHLADAGVVGNPLRFRIAARLADADGMLEAGVYDLETGMPDADVIDQLISGPPIRYTTVIIPEGFTVRQIAERLEKQADIPADDFLALADKGAAQFADGHPYVKNAYRGSLEGYLFPKTYRVEEGMSARDVIEMMLDQFDREVASVDVDAARKAGLSVPELVAVASMIERETRLSKERPLVSSVIHNRLARDMRLQLCATVEYVLPGNRLRLTEKDLQIDSPYNTYRHSGLTPGPIANPGLASLKAAAKPADTDYVYYVLTGKDGSHTFAANAEDFLAAKKKSKEVLGE